MDDAVGGRAARDVLLSLAKDPGWTFVLLRTWAGGANAHVRRRRRARELELAQLLAGQTALGRVGESADVADVIAALIGNDLRWVNAQSIEVAGGYII